MPGSQKSLLPIRVLCVDDNVDATSALRLVIASDPTLSCVGCLSSIAQLETELAGLAADGPLVLILDATMPDQSPLEAMRRLGPRFPMIRTIVHSAHDDPQFIERALNAGAWGFVSKGDDPSPILRAVRAVAAGEYWWPKAPDAPSRV